MQSYCWLMKTKMELQSHLIKKFHKMTLQICYSQQSLQKVFILTRRYTLLAKQGVNTHGTERKWEAASTTTGSDRHLPNEDEGGNRQRNPSHREASGVAAPQGYSNGPRVPSTLCKAD